jgi:hypothetical protein
LRSGSARFLVTALMLMLAVASCSVPGSEPTGQSSTALSQTSASPTPPAPRPPVIDIMAAGAKQLDVFGDWLTVTDNAVWLVGKNSRRLPAMFRLNPSDGAGIAKLDRDLGVRASIPVTEGAAGVRAGLGSVWVSNPEADIVEQIDLKRLKVANKITTGDRPRYMAIGAGSIWALAQVNGSITRYTPATKETIRIEAGLSGAGGDMTFGAGSVWARGAGDRLLIRLDPATNQVVSEYGPAFGAGAVAVGHRAVWISAYNEKKAWRLPLPE